MSVPAARRLWAIVPAAGRGERFAYAASPSIPKQYALLRGKSVLEWSLRALLTESRIQGIVVVLAAGDERWSEIARNLDSAKLLTTIGGAHRQDSVLNGLAYLAPSVQADDWILVHDAARPCLRGSDIGALIDALENIPSGAAGGLGGAVLAAPIVDTVRRELANGLETVDRAGLWRALTPQVFGYAQLRQALEDAAANGLTVSDEAQALERLGIRAALVPGSPFNIKVTRAEDL
ncbi:MAG: 2-C-methyl-D-erythritol 4-phosphate cytidylyltransferase, partial [Steroidobacteraceae bacterium]